MVMSMIITENVHFFSAPTVDFQSVIVKCVKLPYLELKVITILITFVKEEIMFLPSKPKVITMLITMCQEKILKKWVLMVIAMVITDVKEEMSFSKFIHSCGILSELAIDAQSIECIIGHNENNNTLKMESNVFKQGEKVLIESDYANLEGILSRDYDGCDGPIYLRDNEGHIIIRGDLVTHMERIEE